MKRHKSRSGRKIDYRKNIKGHRKIKIQRLSNPVRAFTLFLHRKDKFKPTVSK
jgi:hypothetical protein